MPSLRSFAEAIIYTAIGVVGAIYFDNQVCYSEKYVTWSFGYKVFYYHIAMMVRRFFYYGPFMFSTAAFRASGIAFKAIVDGVEDWNRIRGVYAMKLETETSFINMLRWWNH